ncbi:MAG: prolyl oligopeptidase family serine peptidase [Phycisphaerales bacterium]|nr:prolyl oligopeptidase family serine peptidase [Phycisphaerales bacterium]
MDPRFAQLPQSLVKVSKTIVLGDGVPALVAHPDWDLGEKVPAVIWMHGRTVNKELDPGRYQRWVRGGIGAIALDLPGHGERYEVEYMSPAKTLTLIEQGCYEIDGVLESVESLGVFDMDRLVIGGMSAGGMVTLCRLCSKHPFVGAVVEGTTGNLKELYFPSQGAAGRPWPVEHSPCEVAKVDPMENLDGFRPIPLLALHNEGDEMVPIDGQRVFIDRLKAHYTSLGADPELIQFKTFIDTGAPGEHAGFGKFANDAKNLQLAFLKDVFGMNT